MENAMSYRGRYVCFTFNNPTSSETDAIKSMLQEKCDYAVFGVERGEGGTIHLQGYAELKKRIRLGTFAGMFPRRAHVEARKGSRCQAAFYCMKGDQSHAQWLESGVDGVDYGANSEVWEHGERPVDDKTQGKRTDIEKVRESILCGEIKNEFDLMMSCRSMQAVIFGRQFLNNMPQPVVRAAPLVYWLHGPTGSGKSYGCAEFIARVVKHREWTFWRTNGGFKWFDGYNRQEIAWFDDFRFDGRPTDFAFLLNLLDIYPLRVPIKGGYVTWDPKIILFTAPMPISSAFESLGGREDIGQFERRVSRSYDFGADGAVEFSVNIFSYINNRIDDAVPVQKWGDLSEFGSEVDTSFDIDSGGEDDSDEEEGEVEVRLIEEVHGDDEDDVVMETDDDYEYESAAVEERDRVRGFFEEEASDAGTDFDSEDEI